MSTALAPGRQGWLHSRNGGGEGGIGFSCCLCCHNLAQRLRLGGYALTHSCRSNTIKHIEQLRESIEKIEKAVLASARELPFYSKLTSLPGVGRILGMTITMEVGDIKRFADAGNFASYCRTVEAQRISNSKKKGPNNSKCGNKYLAWAFVEAANFPRRYDEQPRQ